MGLRKKIMQYNQYIKKHYQGYFFESNSLILGSQITPIKPFKTANTMNI